MPDMVENRFARSTFMDLVQGRLQKIVVPVLYDRTNGLDQVGTSTILKVNDHLYLLSAKHVFEGLVADKILIPDNVFGPEADSVMAVRKHR